MIGGTAVDLGVPGTAFFSIAGLCGGVAMWVLASSRRPRVHSGIGTDPVRHDAS